MIELFDYPHDYIPSKVFRNIIKEKIMAKRYEQKERHALLRLLNASKDFRIYYPTKYYGQTYGKKLNLDRIHLIFIIRTIITALGIYLTNDVVVCPITTPPTPFPPRMLINLIYIGFYCIIDINLYIRLILYMLFLGNIISYIGVLLIIKFDKPPDYRLMFQQL